VADESLAIFEQIAVAMAERHEPDLSTFTPSVVRAALERALRSPTSRLNFLTWLNGRVQTLSAGKVTIEARSSDDRSPELAVRILVEGEPFAEPAVIQPEAPIVHYPMRH
jgi:hypothetical protein